jgi:L,D-transpeptidase ErfK/SrfK
MSGENPSRRVFCAGLAATVAFPGAATAQAGRQTASATTPGTTYPDMIGEVRHYFAHKEDTLLDLARINKLGFIEMAAANPGLDPWVPGDGAEVVIPTAHLLPAGPREGVLLNVADQRLYYFPPGGKPLVTYPIGIGREAWATPTGSTKIVRKKRNPSWYVPKSIRKEKPTLPPVVGPGPDNPLGRHAMYLGWQSYLIHGTNNPWGVGRRISHGCVQMYPEDIAELFPHIAIGTPVTVVNQDVKLGWHGGELLLEAHPNLDQNLQLEETGKFSPAPVRELAYRVSQAAGPRVDRVNWRAVEDAVSARSGIPVPILRRAETSMDGTKRASES